MTATLAALLLIAAPRSAGSQEPPDWVETRFHRVWLNNGNFIDGQLVKNTPQGATLSVKSGDITVRQDLIDRIEFMKIRSIREKPIIQPRVRLEPPVKSDPSRADPTPPDSVRPALTVDVDPQIRAKVETLLQRLKKASAEQRGEISLEFLPLGLDAGLYLASRTESLEDDLLTYVGPQLGQFKGAKMTEMLVELTRSRRPSVRTVAAAALVFSGDSSLGRHVIPLLKDPDPIVRGVAADTLALMKHAGAIEPVSKLCLDPDRALRARALASLKKLLEATGRLGSLAQILSDLAAEGQGPARAEAIMNWSREIRKEDWSQVARYLGDGDASVRQAVALALANLAVPESADPVVGQMRAENDKWTRMYLAGAVTKLKAYRAVDTLIAWLADDDGDVRAASWQALRSLTTQSLEPKRELWETYWNSAREKFIK